MFSFDGHVGRFAYHEAFVRAIAESPDDAPRLNDADWLEEDADAGRAEFIRVQSTRTSGSASSAGLSLAGGMP
jgi:uncharacterized protein (TIGR02996 family)